MTMQKTIIGTGIFNLDTIVVREYPEWPAMRPFVEKEVLQEVGGTCGNVIYFSAYNYQIYDISSICPKLNMGIVIAKRVIKPFKKNRLAIPLTMMQGYVGPSTP